MSEDVTNIELELAAERLESIEALLRGYAEGEGCDGVEVVRRGEKIHAGFRFCSFTEKTLNEILLALQAQGATRMLCTVWCESVGEEVVYTLLDGRLTGFASREALLEHQRELVHPPRLSFDYGKPRHSRTALIRLQVKDKGKRRALVACFQGAIRLARGPDFDRFVGQIDGLVKSRTHDVKWCAFKWKDGDSWNEGPAELIHGLIFVVEDDTDVYLGFDLEGLDPHQGRERDSDLEVLILVLRWLDGVSKAWIKVRPGVTTVKELYIYHPGMGDEPAVLRRPLTEDSEWPR